MNFSEKSQGNSLKGLGKGIPKVFKKGDSTGESKPRKINKKPYKMLEAPNLQDDFYLNLLDWSDKNQIAVALDNSLYIWSGCSSDVSRLY